MKLDIELFNLLVGVHLDNSISIEDINGVKEKLHRLIDIAADTARSAKEAGL